MKQAAVLVPLVDGDSGVLLTRRAAHLNSHAGQVSFPGGQIDPEDASPEAAALREAWEEIGLRPDQVEILGRLPDHITGTGYLVTPVVGRVAAGAVYGPASEEVDSVFVLPISVIRDPLAPKKRRAMVRGGEWREFWVWPHDSEYIWGATAHMLVDLAAWLP